MEQKDLNIESKYIKKNSLFLFYNYFTILILGGSSLSLSFFITINIKLIILGILPLILFIMIFIKRKNNIITSVGIYKYSEIFMEILKSVFIKKQDFNKLKTLWKQKMH